MSGPDTSVIDLTMADDDLSSSVVIISDQEAASSPELTPNKITPASKRNRDDLAEENRLDQDEDEGIDDSNPSSESFIRMERHSPEPRRKLPGSTPQKPSSTGKQITIPDVVQSLDDNLPETVTLLRTQNGGKVYLVGTAHFSTESQDDVSKVIRAVQPHRVVVELCSSRMDIIACTEEDILAAAKDLNRQKVLSLIRSHGVVQGIMYLTLLTMSAHVTKQLGQAPGGEFRRAFQEAQKVRNCVVLLGDRPINTTMVRLLASLSWWQCAKLLWSLAIKKDPIKQEDVENAKKRDFLEAMLAEMAGEFPTMKEVLVTERDKYLAYSLHNAVSSNWHMDLQEPCRVVGVVGIGHVGGITEHWGRVTEQDVAQLVTVPPRTLTSRVVGMTVRVALLGGVTYALYKLVPLPYSRLVAMVRP